MAARDGKSTLSYERALDYTFTLLSRRAYTRAQLRERLARKGAAAGTIDDVIARLEELNYVDDAAYADMVIRDRRHRKGPIALRRDLLQKGVPEEIVDVKLADIDEDAQVAVAVEILSKEAWRFRGDAARRRGKAYALLARRGFPSDVAVEAIDTAGGFDDG